MQGTTNTPFSSVTPDAGICNGVPKAFAGADQTVTEGDTVTLNSATITHAVNLATASVVAVKATSEVSFSASFSAGVSFTGGAAFHPGLDISADRGSPVYATADGVVVHASTYSDYGNLVRIDHGFGLESRYGHLQTITVAVGTKVKRGDKIGVHWRIPVRTRREGQREVLVDTNWWKSFPRVVTSPKESFQFNR